MLRSSFRQQGSASVDTTQDFVITNAVVGEMTGFNQTTNVAFGFPPGFAQFTFGCAVVNIINDQSPALLLASANRVIGEVGSSEKNFVVASNRWIAQLQRFLN